MTAPAPEKLLPLPDEASAPFWQGAAENHLMLMRCAECGAWRLPARSHCDECLSDQVRWEQASGKGTVRTFGIMHQAYSPAWAADLPYGIAIVELEEGPRMPASIVGVKPSELRVGMPVVVDFEHHSDVSIPRFRPA
jgi:uncharacterized OB-fold protein